MCVNEAHIISLHIIQWPPLATRIPRAITGWSNRLTVISPSTMYTRIPPKERRGKPISPTSAGCPPMFLVKPLPPMPWMWSPCCVERANPTSWNQRARRSSKKWPCLTNPSLRGQWSRHQNPWYWNDSSARI